MSFQSLNIEHGYISIVFKTHSNSFFFQLLKYINFLIYKCIFNIYHR